MIKQELKNRIIKETELLKDDCDCVGIKIENGKGLFIQVVDYGEKEYLIELNDIYEHTDGQNEWCPCKEYNAFSKFGDIKELIKTIEMYLE